MRRRLTNERSGHLDIQELEHGWGVQRGVDETRFVYWRMATLNHGEGAMGGQEASRGWRTGAGFFCGRKK